MRFVYCPNSNDPKSEEHEHISTLTSFNLHAILMVCQKGDNIHTTFKT